MVWFKITQDESHDDENKIEPSNILVLEEPSIKPRNIESNNGKKQINCFFYFVGLLIKIPLTMFAGYIKYNEYFIING